VSNNLTVIPGDEGSPVIIHVPHSSHLIPPVIRADLMLTDKELADELDEATDTATDGVHRDGPSAHPAVVDRRRPWRSRVPR
jgi:N-formylglutamate deformylase